MIARRRRQTGFTLLELILATMLIALLAASLYASMRIGIKAGDRALAAVDPTRRLVQAMDLVVQDLSAAIVPNGMLAGPFVGQNNNDGAGRDSDTLSFYSIAAAGKVLASTGDIRKVELACQPSPTGRDQDLLRGLTTNLLAPQVPDPQMETLCRHVVSFNLRYFDGASWQDNWDSNALGNVLPAAVEVTLAVAADTTTAAKTGNLRMGSQAGQLSLTRVVPLPCGQDSAQTAASSQ